MMIAKHFRNALIIANGSVEQTDALYVMEQQCQKISTLIELPGVLHKDDHRGSSLGGLKKGPEVIIISST